MSSSKTRNCSDIAQAVRRALHRVAGRMKPRLPSRALSFVEGMGRLIDLSGATDPPVRIPQPRSVKADADNLMSDWQRVGSDIERAMARVKPVNGIKQLEDQALKFGIPTKFTATR